MVTSPLALRLRPLPLSELLDELFRTYRRNFVLMASAGLLLQVPELVFNLLAGQYRTMGFFFNAFSNLGNPDRLDTIVPPQANALYVLLGYATVVLLAPLSAGLLIRITTDVAMGRPTTLVGAFRRTMSRYLGLAGFLLLAVFLATLVALALTLVLVAGFALGSQGNGNGLIIALTVIVAVLMFLAAVVAGAWVGVRLLVVIPAMLEEGIGPISGLRRSWRLVRGSFWRIVGIMLVVYALSLAVSYALTAVTGLLAFVIPGLSGDARGGVFLVALTLVGVVTNPIFAIAISLLYFDLRVRREAMELDQLALAVAPPARPAPALPPPQA